MEDDKKQDKSTWQVMKETIRRLRGKPEEGAEAIAEKLPGAVMPLDAVKQDRERKKRLLDDQNK